MNEILLADDDITFTRILENFLLEAGYKVEICHSVSGAFRLVKQKSFALLLLDYRLPDGTGLDILAEAKKRNIQAPAIIMTSFNDVRTAVGAMRSGAFHYITKPVNHEELTMIIHEALEREKEAEEPVSRLRQVEGESEIAQKLYKQIDLLAPTDLSVLILGESGTGKE